MIDCKHRNDEDCFFCKDILFDVPKCPYPLCSVAMTDCEHFRLAEERRLTCEKCGCKDVDKKSDKLATQV